MKFYYMFAGVGLGMALLSAINLASKSVEVGQCFRYMGDRRVKTVTYVADNKSIEAVDADGDLYTYENGDWIIKVECPK